MRGRTRWSGRAGGSVRRYRPHILVAIALAIVLSTGWHSSLRNALTDLRFAWQSRDASGNVVVVAIDAPSIDQIGVWPWPRGLHAALLRRLGAAGAQDVAFDVDFSTPSDPASDEAFVNALREVGGSTILPSFKQPTPNGGPAHVNRPSSRSATSRGRPSSMSQSNPTGSFAAIRSARSSATPSCLRWQSCWRDRMPIGGRPF